MLIMNAVGAVGIVLTLIQNKYLLLLGRVIWGVAVGVQSVAMPKYLYEFVPNKAYSICIAAYSMSINVGNLFALMSGLIIPKDDNI